jgi:hypothetical protein
MAWTAPPKTETGDMIDAAWLNTYVRDNLLALDTHGHNGASGDGAGTLDSLDEIQWDHQSGLGAGAAGHAAMWMASDGTVKVHNAGGSELTISNTAHTH